MKIMNPKRRFIFFIFFFIIFLFLQSCGNFLTKSHNDNEKRLRDAIILNSKNELGYVRLAQYLEKQQRYSETLSVIRLGQKYIPNSISLLRLEGSLLQGLRKKKESKIFYAKQIEKHPNNPMLYLDRAKLRMSMKEKNLAMADARKALNLKPDYFEAIYLIGLILSHSSLQNNSEQFDQALEQFIAASKINDQSPELWFRISVLWEKNKNTKMAKMAMIKAVELSPESEPFLRRLVVLLEKELDETIGNNTFKVAKTLRKTLLHMLKLFPKNAWVNAHYGNWAWSQGNFSLAEKHFKYSLKLKSIYPWASFRLGIVYISQKKWEHALLELERGLKYDPKNEWAIEKIGFVLEMLGKNEDAIKRYEWLMEDNSANIIVFNRLNNLYWNDFLFQKGEETLLRGLEKYPSEITLIEKLVNYYDSQGLYKKAKTILSSFIKFDPKNSNALAKLGFYENKLKRPESALDFFNKALKISPDFEWAKKRQISTLLSIKKNQIAEKELKHFLNLKPNSEWALIELSKLKMKNKKFTDAESILKKSLLNNKESSILLITLAELLKQKEQWIEAEEIFKKLLKLNPNNSSFLTNLAFVQWKMNSIPLARINIKKALYENTNNFLAWNLHIILLSKFEQKKWFGENLTQLLPVLKIFANQGSTKNLEKIKSVRIDPFSTQILNNLYYLVDGFSEEILLDPIDITSKNLPPWVHEKWSYFNEILGDTELAKAHLEIVSNALPNNSWIHARLGWIYEKLEKFEKSQYHYQKFLNEHPDAFEINFRLANIKILLGKEKSTIDIYEKLILKRPRNDLVLNNLAWLLLTANDKKLRNIKKGLTLAKRSVEIFPTIDNLDTLAEAYFQSGKNKKAINIIRRAVKEVFFHPNRQSYLRKQFLRFQNGNQNTNPPALSKSLIKKIDPILQNNFFKKKYIIS